MRTRTIVSHTVRSALGMTLLPLVLNAGDAVVLNANGTTQFAYTVSGPNVLGTAAPVPIAGVTTLDASAAGKIYTISGTTNYTITLPSAGVAGVGAGTILAFSVEPSVSANPQYTIAAAPTETLDGRASLALIPTNYLEIMSVGGKWVSRVRKLDTDWSLPVQIPVGALSSPPNKGAWSVDEMRWRRSGSNVEVTWTYWQTGNTGSVAGSGDYTFSLPNGLSIDTSAVRIATGGPTITQGTPVGTGQYSGISGTHYPGPITVIPYSASTVRFLVNCDSTSAPLVACIGTQLVSFASASFGFTARAAIPVLGW